MNTVRSRPVSHPRSTSSRFPATWGCDVSVPDGSLPTRRCRLTMTASPRKRDTNPRCAHSRHCRCHEGNRRTALGLGKRKSKLRYKRVRRADVFSTNVPYDITLSWPRICQGEPKASWHLAAGVCLSVRLSPTCVFPLPRNAEEPNNIFRFARWRWQMHLRVLHRCIMHRSTLRGGMLACEGKPLVPGYFLSSSSKKKVRNKRKATLGMATRAFPFCAFVCL